MLSCCCLGGVQMGRGSGESCSGAGERKVKEAWSWKRDHCLIFPLLLLLFFFSFTSSLIDGGVSVRSIAWEYLLTPWSKYPNSSSLYLSDSSSQWKPSREPRPSAEITLLGRGKQEPIKLTFGFANKGLGAGQLTCGQPFGAAFLKTTVMERFLWGCRATIDIKSRRNAC